jgi:probable rRNA maturation factor
MSPPKRLNLSVQYACHKEGLPLRPQLRQWTRAALDVDGQQGGQITVRFVDEAEGLALNSAYRGKDYPTNVLSFPYESEPRVWGDLVLCVPVVQSEAAAQNKPLEAHFAHLIVHGMLHLQGYDHEQNEEEARTMESRERELLATLGYPDPYSGEA